MNIKKLSLDDPRWDKFCLESDDCWFWHTTDWMKYTMEYNKDIAELYAFYIEDGNKEILAICPLIRQKNSFTFSEEFGPNPALRNGLSEKLSKRLLGDVFSHIDKLAVENGVQEVLIYLTSLSRNHLKSFTYNYLMKYGYNNISLNTQILDLEKDQRTLWGEIKKSHRNEIKRGKSLFKFSIMTENNASEKVFKDFQHLHKLAAGRVTRSNRTWEIQYEWLTQGKIVLINAHMDGKLVGGIYSILYKDGAYYGGSANHPDHEDLPISHSIQWEIIKWLKNNRFRYYDLGYQHFSDQPYNHPPEKEINISLFKRHFGGYTITQHRGIKRYIE